MPRLEGHLELVCAADAAGRSFFRRQSFSAPFHLSKPYWDGQVLVTQIANPTAGLFAGDRLRSDVRVESGARLHLTSPSASRVHTMPDGRAEVLQNFHVTGGAWFEYFPAPLIPQTGSRYRQVTRVTAEATAELFFVETVAPGRVARGERFAFSEIDWEVELRLDNRLLARERFCLRPDDDSLASWQALYPNAYFVSAWLLTRRVDAHANAWNAIRAETSRDVTLGFSQVAPGLWSIKFLAADGVSTTNALAAIRRGLSSSIPELRCSARKL